MRSPDLAVERVRERVRIGGHDVAAAIIERRYQKGLHNLFTLYLPLADSWAVYDNSIAGSPQVIALGRGMDNRAVYDQILWEKLTEVAG